MNEPKLLSLRDVLKYCQRSSGRSTALLDLVCNFLLESNDYDEMLGIIVSKNTIADIYVENIRKKLQPINGLIEYRSQMVFNKFNDNRVLFFTLDESLNKRGLRFKDIYFDTPETDACISKLSHLGPLLKFK